MALAACSATSAEALPGLLTQIGRGSSFAVRPAQVIYTGDGSGVLGGFTGKGPLRHFGQLRWSSWTNSQARGSGAVWLDDCTPNCAQGTFHPYAVQIRAFGAHSGHFTRLTLHYTYKGKHVVDQRGVAKYGAYYGYYIVSYTP
jgi:hypothetical protein